MLDLKEINKKFNKKYKTFQDIDWGWIAMEGDIDSQFIQEHARFIRPGILYLNKHVVDGMDDVLEMYQQENDITFVNYDSKALDELTDKVNDDQDFNNHFLMFDVEGHGGFDGLQDLECDGKYIYFLGGGFDDAKGNHINRIALSEDYETLKFYLLAYTGDDDEDEEEEKKIESKKNNYIFDTFFCFSEGDFGLRIPEDENGMMLTDDSLEDISFFGADGYDSLEEMLEDVLKAIKNNKKERV